MIEPAGVVVEAEEERADERLAGGVAEAADHAIGGADVLHLEHGADLGLVEPVEALADDAVDRAAGPGEPGLRLDRIAGVGRERDAGGPAGEDGFERSAAGGERFAAEVASAVAEEVEGDEGRRGLAGEL